MHTLGIAVTALPLLVLATVVVLVAVALSRSLRDDAVLDQLRAEVRSVGEVRRAVLEVRTSPAGSSERR